MRRLAPWALGLLLQPAAALAEEAEPPTCEPTSTLDVYGLGTPGDESRTSGQAARFSTAADLLRDGRVRIAVYDASGRLVLRRAARSRKSTRRTLPEGSG